MRQHRVEPYIRYCMTREKSQAAIVTTLRNAGASLESFIAYHLAIGFAHIFLFFDDADDPDRTRAAGHPQVTAIAHDAALRAAWQALPQYEAQAPFLDREVMARQVLNVAYAMELARARGFDWLLNIDADELFHTPGGRADAHFASLSEEPVDTVNYPNYEALPESDTVRDCFREVTLFKVPPELNRVALTPQGLALLKMVPQLNPDFFHYYSAGKSAVRLAAPGMEPNGVHAFTRSGGNFRAARNMQHAILHYAVCGFDALWSKYATLGKFPDAWWDRYDIEAAIGRFHLDARDVVAAGNRDAALAFYRQRVALEDPALVDALMRHGFLARFSGPCQILAR